MSAMGRTEGGDEAAVGVEFFVEWNESRRRRVGVELAEEGKMGGGELLGDRNEDRTRDVVALRIEAVSSLNDPVEGGFLFHKPARNVAEVERTGERSGVEGEDEIGTGRR